MSLILQDRSKEDTWKESDLKKALKVRNVSMVFVLVF